MNIRIGFYMFRLRQLTGIPFTRLAEIAADVAYNALKDNSDLKMQLVENHSIRDPDRQIEIDIKKGYDKVI